MLTQEQRDELPYDVLAGVDHAMFEEELEERILMDEIAMKIANKFNIEVM
jgi:hypothetical protein